MYKRPHEQHERTIKQMVKDEKTQKTQKTTEEKEKRILNSLIYQNNKYEKFATILDSMLQTYKAKNADYGDSFHNTVEKYGLIAALTRIADKFHRIENLIISSDDQKVKDESLRDTLIDLASYSIMTVMELDDTFKKK